MSDGPLLAPAPADPAALDAFFRHVRSVNPYLDNRVNAPSANDVDVIAIHHAAFMRLTELADEALNARRGIGALLWGQAGIGKSHVLSRLGRWAARDGRACFVYLHNLQAAPETLPRSLLHAVVSILTQGRRQNFAPTPLFDLARAALREAIGKPEALMVWPTLERAYNAWVDRLSAGLPGSGFIDRTVYDVLYRFFRSAFRAAHGKEDGREAELAVRWLSGVGLDPGEARLLGLPPGRHADEPAALADGQQVKSVLVALSRLAVCRNQPFLLVFDQVDNLDADQVGALARFLEALIDSAPNLLAITAGIQTTLLPWHERGVIPDSAWDRIAQVRILLNRLNPSEALAILRARLDAFLGPYAELEPVQRLRQADPLFPLGMSWVGQLLADKEEVRPRDALNAAREGWRRHQEALGRLGGPGWLQRWPAEPAPVLEARPAPEERIDRVVEEKMREHLDQCLRVPGSLPPDGDHMAGLLFALLEQCHEAGRLFGIEEVDRLPAPRRGTRPTYDLALTQRSHDGSLVVRTGVVAVTAPSAVSVTGFLRRLVEESRPLDRVVLVSDERVGLPLGERGEQYLRELKQAGPERFRVVEMTLREYAELEALQQPVWLARSGDLEVSPQPGRAQLVGEREVIASHRRRGRYGAARVLREVLAAVPEVPPPAAESPAPTPAPAL
jgi:hypothetical protein